MVWESGRWGGWNGGHIQRGVLLSWTNRAESQVSRAQRTSGWESRPYTHRQHSHWNRNWKHGHLFPQCYEGSSWLSFLIFFILWIYLGSVPIYCKLWFSLSFLLRCPEELGLTTPIISNGLLLLIYNCETLETNVTCNCTQLKGHRDGNSPHSHQDGPLKQSLGTNQQVAEYSSTSHLPPWRSTVMYI